MGSAQSIAQVAEIVRTHPQRQKVVTVSAMSGVTNMLIESAQCAISSDDECIDQYAEQIQQKHISALGELVHSDSLYSQGAEYIRQKISDFAGFLRALSIVGEISPRSHDAVVSLGEHLSAFLLSQHMQEIGENAVFTPLEHLVESCEPRANSAFFAETTTALAYTLVPIIQRDATAICTGFIGRIPGGIVQGVGRGYSDCTAALIGKACGASEIEIWTDVSGILSTDPRIVPTAHSISELSFAEASELAYFGAKVIHPQTIWPAVEDSIVVRIKNTMDPKAVGTKITKRGCKTQNMCKSVTVKKGVSIVTMTSPVMKEKGLMAQIFDLFAQHNIAIDLISTSEVSVSVTVENASPISGLLPELEKIYDVQVQDQKAIVAVVGAEMKEHIGTSGAFFGALARAHINIDMISQGASEINISAVVQEVDVENAIETVHAAFFENSAGQT